MQIICRNGPRSASHESSRSSQFRDQPPIRPLPLLFLTPMLIGWTSAGTGAEPAMCANTFWNETGADSEAKAALPQPPSPVSRPESYQLPMEPLTIADARAHARELASVMRRLTPAVTAAEIELLEAQRVRLCSAEIARFGAVDPYQRAWPGNRRSLIAVNDGRRKRKSLMP